MTELPGLRRRPWCSARLDATALRCRIADLVLYSYVRKEAVLSSQIEGTQTSLADLLLFEMHESAGCAGRCAARWPTTWPRSTTA